MTAPIFLTFHPAEREPFVTKNNIRIWDVVDQNGQKHSTMSERIAQGGTFDVEFRTNDYGKTYVRQAVKEGQAPATGGSQPRQAAPKTYQADPVKMKQDRELAISKGKSIQREVAVKAAVELIVADKRDYAQLEETYNDLMQLLESGVRRHFDRPDDGRPADESTAEKAVGEPSLDDLPPVETYNFTGDSK